MLGTPESERLKVAALDLFHPTAPPLFQEVGFFILRHSLSGGWNFSWSPSSVVLEQEGEERTGSSLTAWVNNVMKTL